MGNGRPHSQSANAFQIQRSDRVEKPRPQSIYILDPGTGWLVEHHDDHQYPAKEIEARYPQFRAAGKNIRRRLWLPQTLFFRPQTPARCQDRSRHRGRSWALELALGITGIGPIGVMPDPVYAARSAEIASRGALRCGVKRCFFSERLN
jgi:hypothetical protein